MERAVRSPQCRLARIVSRLYVVHVHSDSAKLEVRKQLKGNPDMKAKDVVEALGKKGIKVQESTVYFIKGKVSGRKGRRKKAQQMVAKDAATGNADPVAAILKVKSLASDLGGLKKLKALVDALGV